MKYFVITLLFIWSMTLLFVGAYGGPQGLHAAGAGATCTAFLLFFWGFWKAFLD